MRIVSLLPSTTEILFALGAGDEVVGVTFECDFPPEAKDRRIVSTSALPAGLAPGEIDAFVAAAIGRGDDLYHLDRGALADLDADLVVTQDLCAVCAVDVTVVEDALAYLGCRAQVLTIDPHTVEEVWASFLALGEATGRTEQALAIVADQRRRVAATALRRALARRPRVAVLEWTDPPFTPGHWVPEMVELAGGTSVLGEAGEPSRRTTWGEVRGAEPDMVVVAPCGYDRAGAQRLADGLADTGVLQGVPCHAVDANASWARPGTRLVDGIEELADILSRRPR